MQHIFMAVVGRTGQFSFCEIVNKYGIGCYAEAEPPDLPFRWKYSPRFFYNLQRKYLATHEMLGRGKAMEWYENDDSKKLDQVVLKKVKRIERIAQKKGITTYFEASKFFLRTQCDSFHKFLPDLKLVKLTRDPISNARSFSNRNKDFYLDNVPPNYKQNCLQLDPQELSKFQLYLWSWMEMELRYYRFVDKFDVKGTFEIKLNDLNSKEKIEELFRHFGIEHREITDLPRLNTNVGRGLPATKVNEEDLEEYYSFLEKIPMEILEKIEYLRDYNPESSL